MSKTAREKIQKVEISSQTRFTIPADFHDQLIVIVRPGANVKVDDQRKHRAMISAVEDTK